MQKNKWVYLGALGIIIIITVVLILFPPVKKKKDTVSSDAKKKITLSDITFTSSLEEISDVEAYAPTTSIEETVDDEVIVSAEPDKGFHYPTEWDDLWRVDGDGNKFIIINGEPMYKSELEEMKYDLTIDDFNERSPHTEEDELLHKAMYPVRVNFALYSVEGSEFTEDVPLPMSIQVLETSYERFQPWLVEQGFGDEAYLVYSHTKYYDKRLDPDNYGKHDSLFYVMNEESFNEWNKTQNRALLEGKKEIWIHFNEWDGVLSFELK